MSGVQEFVCHDCTQFWRDEYSFWNGYQSTCPRCGKSCEAVCDTQVFADQQEMEGLYDGPLFDFEGETAERTEADLESERDQIRDEICEALGAVEPETSDADEDSDTDEDADGDADGSGDGF
jgi:hypothetical protein